MCQKHFILVEHAPDQIAKSLGKKNKKKKHLIRFETTEDNGGLNSVLIYCVMSAIGQINELI